MALRLLLLTHATTAAMRRGQLPADDALDERAVADIHAVRARLSLPADAVVFASPAACAVTTAHELGLAAMVAPALADVDYGRWRGQSLKELAATEADALQSWLQDPAMVAHGGESFSAAQLRVGQWMDALPHSGTVLAITHAVIVRAALLYALEAAPAAFRHLEAAPLSLTSLQRSTRGWIWSPALL